MKFIGKVFTVLFAFVLAFAVFAFAACNNEPAPDPEKNEQPDDKNPDEETPDEGDVDDNEPDEDDPVDEEPELPEKAKLSEEQWIAAFTALAESRNFAVNILQCDSDSGEMEILLAYEVDGNVIKETWYGGSESYYSYDEDTKSMTVYSEYGGEWSTYIPSYSEYNFDAEWIEDGELEGGGYYYATGNYELREMSFWMKEQDFGDAPFSLCKFGNQEFYGKFVTLEILDGDYYYEYGDYYYEYYWVTEDSIVIKEIPREFESLNDILLNWCEFGDLRLLEAYFSGTMEDGTAVDGEMKDLYPCFAYDEEEDSYIFFLDGYYCELYFEDGKISEATIILNYGDEWEQRLYCTFTFGSADITLPDVAAED